ncbi:MAG: hypothetical protein V4493_08645 [Pseudomonadota bacterium]
MGLILKVTPKEVIKIGDDIYLRLYNLGENKTKALIVAPGFKIDRIRYEESPSYKPPEAKEE